MPGTRPPFQGDSLGDVSQGFYEAEFVKARREKSFSLISG
jgi:hypothetical protein